MSDVQKVNQERIERSIALCSHMSMPRTSWCLVTQSLKQFSNRVWQWISLSRQQAAHHTIGLLCSTDTSDLSFWLSSLIKKLVISSTCSDTWHNTKLGILGFALCCFARSDCEVWHRTTWGRHTGMRPWSAVLFHAFVTFTPFWLSCYWIEDY